MNQTTKKIILITTMGLLLMSMVSATELLNQFFGVPNSYGITNLRIDGNGYGLFRNTNDEYFKYNGTTWYQIPNPPETITGTTIISFTKTLTRIYAQFGNASTTQLFEYNAGTGFNGTWTLVKTYTRPSTEFGRPQFECNELLGNTSCHYAVHNSTNRNTYIYNALTDALVTSTQAPSGYEFGEFFYKKKLWITETNGYNSQIKRYSGISWQTMSGASLVSYNDYTDLWEYDDNYFMIGATDNRIRRYNQTSATVQNLLVSPAQAIQLMVDEDDDKHYFFGSLLTSTYYLGRLDYYYDPSVTTFDEGISPTCTANAENSDQKTGINTIWGFSGCLTDGRIFEIGSSPTNITTTETFNTITIANPNPATYGTTTTFTTTVTNTYSSTANATITIEKDAGATLCQSWTLYPATTGSYSATNSISGSGAWTNCPIGIYNVTTNISDGLGHTATYHFNWEVIANTTINTTNYTITDYATNDDYTQIYAITKVNNNKIYSTGNNLTAQHIISYDVTNPDNIIRKTIEINDTTSFSEPTSISYNNNTLYLGTDDELYAFSNAQYGDATQLTQDASTYSFGSLNQRINDLEAIPNGAWMCQQGLIYDELTLYNRTDNSTTTTLTADPCYGLTINNNIAYVRLSNSIKIYNLTDQNLLATITGLSTPYAGARHDLISISGNHLYTISGNNYIRHYNITDPTSPSLLNSCYNNYGTTSLEAIDDTTVITGYDTGIITGLRVCDYTNALLYDIGSNTYSSTNLKTYSNGEIPHEIILLSTGKIAVAENNRVGIHTYTKETTAITTNNPPTINSITTSTATPCVNQTIQVTIEATDTDNPQDLTYDWDCNGIEAVKTHNYLTNTFTCQYDSAGTKTIKAWVSDGYLTVLNQKNVVASICNTTNFLNFKVLDGITGLPISGVLINIVGETSGITDTAGQSTFNLPTASTYEVSFSKNNYVTTTNQFTTNNLFYNVYLEPTTTTTGTRTILYVNVVDRNSQPIVGATVSATDPITAIAKTTSTNALGIATLLDVTSGVDLRISAGKSGYTTQFTQQIILAGETKTITITLPLTTETTSQQTARGCQDYVDGWILCEPLNNTGGNGCTTNTDCVGGRCQPSGFCSNVNWTRCDQEGQDRGSWCATTVSLKKAGNMLEGAILENFLYFALFVIIIILFLILMKNIRR